MKNILLITTIYPLPDKKNYGTHVCHYFAREWNKMGYNVKVVHYQAVFPFPYYWLAKLFRDRIAANTGAVVYTEKDKGGFYQLDGVSILRIPLLKLIPHGNFVKYAINNSIKRISDWLNYDDFYPDFIIGHFPNPQIEVVSCLKDLWPKSKTAIVMHLESENLSIHKLYGQRFNEMSRHIDVWGFRNEYLRQLFKKQVMPLKNSFICYSGIPSDYIVTNNYHDYRKPLRNFIYVGEMIERKYPIEVLNAIQKVYPHKDFTLRYVGQGSLMNIIQRRIEQDNLMNNVQLLGKIPRDKIKEQYDNADCMVMISKGEAYGLVYLEAMARGCITIASRNEGFDGVIINGVNGFLCEAGNDNELATIIQSINDLEPEERLRISEKAIATAKRLTDENAARMYLDDLNAIQ